jgi:hypothetical protein
MGSSLSGRRPYVPLWSDLLIIQETSGLEAAVSAASPRLMKHMAASHGFSDISDIDLDFVKLAEGHASVRTKYGIAAPTGGFAFPANFAPLLTARSAGAQAKAARNAKLAAGETKERIFSTERHGVGREGGWGRRGSRHRRESVQRARTGLRLRIGDPPLSRPLLIDLAGRLGVPEAPSTVCPLGDLGERVAQRAVDLGLVDEVGGVVQGQADAAARLDSALATLQGGAGRLTRELQWEATHEEQLRQREAAAKAEAKAEFEAEKMEILAKAEAAARAGTLAAMYAPSPVPAWICTTSV